MRGSLCDSILLPAAYGRRGDKIRMESTATFFLQLLQLDREGPRKRRRRDDLYYNEWIICPHLIMTMTMMMVRWRLSASLYASSFRFGPPFGVVLASKTADIFLLERKQQTRKHKLYARWSSAFSHLRVPIPLSLFCLFFLTVELERLLMISRRAWESFVPFCLCYGHSMKTGLMLNLP